MKKIDLSILVVNYKTKDITIQSIDAVFASKTKYTYEVVVVDNNSEDGSIEVIAKKFPQIVTIASKENGGFAKANNLAASKAVGTYVWLLNSDTIINETTIEKLMDEAIKNDAYVASCQLRNKDGSIQPQGGALPTVGRIAAWMLNYDRLMSASSRYQNSDISSFETNRPAGWLGGTALLVRRDLYLSMSGLDDHIFMYGEDVEFCIRVHHGRLPIHYFSSANLIHLGQASGSSERAILGEFSGLKYIYQKHYPQQLGIVRMLLKLGALLRTVMYTFTGDTKRRDIYAKAIALA
jgi:GT2 family glycosyltransferase